MKRDALQLSGIFNYTNETLKKVFAKAGLDMVPSTMCMHQQ
jgi:hypothetical protein